MTLMKLLAINNVLVFKYIYFYLPTNRIEIIVYNMKLEFIRHVLINLIFKLQTTFSKYKFKIQMF